MQDFLHQQIFNYQGPYPKALVATFLVNLQYPYRARFLRIIVDTVVVSIITIAIVSIAIVVVIVTMTTVHVSA